MPGKEAFLLGVELGEFLQQLLLLGAQFLRHFQVHAHEHVALAAEIDPVQTGPLELEISTRLRAWRYGQLGRSEKRGDLDLRSQRGVGERDLVLDQQVRPFTLEYLMIGHMYDDEQIAGMTAVRRPLSGTGNTKFHARVDPLRDLELDLLRLPDVSVAVALGAR